MDLKYLMSVQQENMALFHKAQHNFIETIQEAGKLQMEIWGGWFESSSNILHESAATGKPEEKMQRQASVNQKAYETSVKNWKALVDLSSESRRTFSDLVKKRVTQAYGDVKDILEDSNNPWTVGKAA